MDGSFDVARELATELREHEGKRSVYVIAVAPESLRLAAEIARRLRLPFDLFPVRPLRGANEQGQPVGLVASGGMLVLERGEVAVQGCSISALAEEAHKAASALADFEREFRDGVKPPDLRGSTVILVDDGRTPALMLLMTMTVLRRCWVRATVLAVPTLPVSALKLVSTEADAVVCVVVPDGAAPLETDNLEPSMLPTRASLAFKPGQSGCGQAIPSHGSAQGSDSGRRRSAALMPRSRGTLSTS